MVWNYIGDSHEFEAGMTSVSVACFTSQALKSLSCCSVMGGSWSPYLIGIIIGHFGTLLGWAFTAVIEALVGILKGDTKTAIKLIDQVSPHPASDHSSTATTTTSSVVAGFRKLGLSSSLDSAGDNEGYLWWVLVLALVSWSAAIYVGAVLWIRRRSSGEDLSPVSPSLEALARQQLAEIRLRRHGIGR